jgi:hypothetical protein
MLGRVASPQLGIQLIYGSKVTVESKPFPRRETFSFQLFEIGNSLAEGLISHVKN